MLLQKHTEQSNFMIISIFEFLEPFLLFFDMILFVDMRCKAHELLLEA